MKRDFELLALEQSFIKFISERNSLSVENTREAYLNLKDRFKFSSKEYRVLCENVHSLYEMFYVNANEQGLIEAYKKLEYLHIFRHISYAFPIKESLPMQFKKYLKSLKNHRVPVKSPFESLLEILHEQKETIPIVVDYGAGLGHLSYKIGQLFNDSKIYLIDIDSIILRFAEFYFKEIHLDISTIKVDARNLYPILPACNVCICSEVLEHVRDPHLVFDNIIRSLQSGGLLYGNFEDHLDEFLHVSTDLSDIRVELGNEFNKLSNCIYRKK
jgi:hypothetical protein